MCSTMRAWLPECRRIPVDSVPLWQVASLDFGEQLGECLVQRFQIQRIEVFSHPRVAGQFADPIAPIQGLQLMPCFKCQQRRVFQSEHRIIGE